MKPIICFDTAISQDSVEHLLTYLRSANSSDTILIDSPGGTFDFFSVLGPAISRLGVTTVANRVYSAASILFALGRERIVHPESEILFHEVRVMTLDGRHITVGNADDLEALHNDMRKRPTEEFEEWRRQMHNAQDWFIRFMARHTKCSAHRIRYFIEHDAVLTGEEAYRYGIATKYGNVHILD